MGSARAAGGQAGQRRAWCGRRGGPCSRGGVVSGTTESHPRADSAEAWQGRCAPSRQCGHVTSPTFLCVGRFSLLGSPLHKMLWLLKTRVLILPRGPGRAPGAGDGGGAGAQPPAAEQRRRPAGPAAAPRSPPLPCSPVRSPLRQEQGGRLRQLPPLGGAGLRHRLRVQHLPVRQRQALRPPGRPVRDHAGLRGRGAPGGPGPGQAPRGGSLRARGGRGDADEDVKAAAPRRGGASSGAGHRPGRGVIGGGARGGASPGAGHRPGRGVEGAGHPRGRG